MSIKIIEQSTDERKQETIELYNKCLPYLEQGCSIHKAASIVTGRKPNNTKNGWYKDLIEYSIAQGHDYHGTRWKRIKIIERTTEDVEKETKELFEQCRPLLDEGYGFYKALRVVKGIPESSCFGNQEWYKRFRDYAVTQGYHPRR